MGKIINDVKRIYIRAKNFKEVEEFFNIEKLIRELL